MTGKFIVLEGIDGSGKTTLCDVLAAYLREKGHEVQVTQEPTHDEIGSLIRDNFVKNISQKAEALLFTADRAVHTERIARWIGAGIDVICDRYFASTVAYQSASLNGVSLDKDWLLDLNEPVVMEPDVTFLLDINPEKGMERVCTRGERSKFENVDYLKEVRQRYLELADEYGFKLIDASRDRETVAEEALEIIKELF